MNKALYKAHIFRQFAEKRLENHFEELKTCYQNKSVSSVAVRQQTQAYKEHSEVFEGELDQQIESLNKDNNTLVKTELENLKRDYVARLTSKKM